KVGRQFFPGLKVHVEGDKIQKRQLEILGTGETHIGHQCAGIFRLDRFATAPYDPFDARLPVPPPHAGRNLIADHETKPRRMAGEPRDIGAQITHDAADASRIVAECDVLLPRQPDHDAQAVGRCDVHQPARRQGIDADRIESGDRHRLEIALDDGPGRKLNARRIGPERPIGDAADPEFLVADIQELAAHIRPLHVAMTGHLGLNCGVAVVSLAGRYLGNGERDPLKRRNAHTSSDLTLSSSSLARGANCFPYQSHAVRTIVRMSDICGVHCSTDWASCGSAISAAGSPARRKPCLSGTGLPPTASTAVMTSRTEYPRPVPRLTLMLAPPASR